MRSSVPSGIRVVADLIVLAAAGLFAALPPSEAQGEGAGRLSPRASTADFNGDGFADMAIGVEYEDLGPIADAGAVNVLYGSTGGIQAEVPDDQLWFQAQGIGDGPDAGDHFGATLAAGDFDGDGFADLAVGAPGEDVGSVPDAGAVSVLYGSAGGLQIVDPQAQFWTQDTAGVADQADPSDGFGITAVAGDFDGDGFDDLAVGAPFEDLAGLQDPGSTNVLYGSFQGLQTTAPVDQFWTQDSPGVEDEAQAMDTFRAVAAGDFDGDGYEDLANGAPGESVSGAQQAGAINVLYGSPQGLQTIAPADQFWTQDSPWVDGTAGLGDHFGLVGSAGDFNGEGYDDLAIGVPSQSVEGQTDAGAVNVLYGSSEGLQTDNPDDPENAPDDQLWTQDSPFLGGLAEAGDEFGSQVAAGDFNGDGRDDLAVGPNGEDIEGTTNAGGVNLIYGSVVGLQAVLPDDQLWNQDEPGVTDTNEPGDRFAWDLAALDYNGDGFADLTVSIPGEDVGSIVQGGAVAVLYGSPGGVQADSPDDQFWSQEGPSVKEATEPRDAFGAALGP